jgi:uncharacterized membrane protein YkoI
MRSAVKLLVGAALLAAGLVTSPTEARAECLSRRDQRAAVRSGEVVRPGTVGKQLGEVLQVRLCHAGGGLVWRLTVLGRDGRVVEHVVDAGSGRLRR